MHILIVGGRGTAGRVLTRHALAAGHRVRILARTPEPKHRGDAEIVVGDLLDGTGLADAVSGVDAVVDLSNTTAAGRQTATRFFTTGTRQLFEAEHGADVRHHLTLSIVGVDALPSGYYRAKVAQEEAVREASRRTGVGHTIARVTQFHDFAAFPLQQLRVGPLVFAPPLHVRPVHLDDVAAHLLGLLEEGPSGYADELSGPRDEDLVDMTRRLARVTHRRVLVAPAPLIGGMGTANRANVLRPAAGRRGRIDFDTWLAEQS